MSASTGAWVRRDDNSYGSGKYPFGVCQTAQCAEPACHEVPANDLRGKRRVCRLHVPKHLFFVPFLGQQTKLFAATERWVLGGGGAGGSKTYAGARLWLKQWRQEQARFMAAKERGEEFQSKGWALFLRRTIPELLQVIEDFKKYKDLVGPNRWSEQQKLCIYENGYKVQFGGMENETDYLKYYGGEYTLVVVDEATQFTKKQIQEIDSRIRCADPELDRLVQLYLLTNPIGGDTKAWLRRRYVKQAAPETPLLIKAKLADGRELTERQVYIPCNLYDNPTLVASGRYEMSLMQKGSAMRRALLLNDWDVDEGSWIGDDWDPAVHICKPFAIPKSWPKFKCGDYGYSFPSLAVVHWLAVDPDGNLVVYRSWATRRMTAREFGLRIKAIESEPLWYADKKTGKRIMVVDQEWDMGSNCSTVTGPMDAALWATNGEDGESRGEILENIGCGFYKSDKGPRVRHDAADQIRTRLRHRGPDASGSFDPGVPGLRFFKYTTESRVADEEGNPEITGPTHTLPILPFDPADPDVPDTKANDHDWDALAYGVMTRPVGEAPEEPEVIDFVSFRAAKSAGKIQW